MYIFKKLAMLITVTGLALGFATCASAQVTWTFSDVTFNNGAAVTGSFVTNSTVTSVLSFDIGITGPGSFTAELVDSAYLPGEVGIASDSSFDQYIDLYLSSSMTGAGGIIPIGSGYECPGCGVLNTAATDTTHDPELIGTTPEPATVGLMLLGLGLLLGTRIAQRVRRTNATNRA
jgi:hypothetical protein